MNRSAVVVSGTLLLGLVGSTHAADVKLLKPPSTFPLVINAPGSYRLKKNFTVPNENTTAISITADNVTLDLNGYAITGPTVCSGFPATCAPTGTGIGVSSSSTNVTVLNGTIRGMGDSGILSANRIEKVNAVGNGGTGMNASVVIDSLADSNGGQGISAGNSVTNSTATANGGPGIASSNVNNCTAGNNGNLGISATNVTNSLAAGNTTFGIAGQMVSNSTAFANGGDGILGGTVTNSTADSNGGFGISGSNVTNSTATSNVLVGLSLGATAGYAQNVVNSNNGGNAFPQVTGGIQTGTNVCGGDTTCP